MVSSLIYRIRVLFETCIKSGLVFILYSGIGVLSYFVMCWYSFGVILLESNYDLYYWHSMLDIHAWVCNPVFFILLAFNRYSSFYWHSSIDFPSSYVYIRRRPFFLDLYIIIGFLHGFLGPKSTNSSIIRD